MRLLAVLLVGAAEPDMGPDRDQARSVVGVRRLDGGFDRCDVIAVLDLLGMPLVGIEALQHVLRPGHRRRAIELDAVVVIEHDQFAEAEVAGQAGRFGRDALLEVAVGGDDIGPVIDDVAAGSVELGPEARLRDRHPDCVGESLTEWPRGRLDPRREAVLGVTRRDAAPLPERLQVVERDVVAGQVQERVEEHAGVPGAQHEPIAIRPFGVRWRVAQEARPQDVRHRCGAHRGARMTGIGLLDAVDRERPDRIDGELIEVRSDGHRGHSDR